jgi:hypothetical protein
MDVRRFVNAKPPPISHPKLVEIDNALAALEPTLNEFGHSLGFILLRGHGQSCNIPRRWLRRCGPYLHQDIGLVIAASIFERLERGFYPSIPCCLYVMAHSFASRRFCSATIVEAQPYTEFRLALPQHLADAHSQIEAWTPEFIDNHGESSEPSA